MTLWCPRLHPERGRAAVSLFALKRLWLGEHIAAEDMLKVKPGDTNRKTPWKPQILTV